ncbi:MAG TPA: DUF4337 domain-containing protein [Caulobacteraceae bacterium]|nr:DUF4337 domain-containing protein [Caulobacteraceae bacterium]
MEVEVSAEAKDKRLNNLVALTVVVLSIFMGLASVKDGNLVQAMEQAQASSIDLWNEYQATRIKRHMDEVALNELGLTQQQTSAIAAEKARLTAEMAKYDKEAPELRKKAEGATAQYDAINYHDDQFDAADALISIGVAVAAVAALAESFPALFVSWLFGGLGMVMGLAGFLNLPFHLDWLAKLLS